MAFLIPKNWSDFQHYKDRAPAWIKLHADLLDNFEFHCLQLASRALAPMLWLLASKYEGGKIPLDVQKIAFRLRMDATSLEAALKPLIDGGFFVVEQDASEVPAECLPRERGEEEKETDISPNGDMSSAAADDLPACPHGEIIDLYNRTLAAQGWTTVNPKFWKGSRADSLRARWREDARRQNLDWWRGFFEHVAESDFLMGRTQSAGRAPFRGDLEWLVTFRNFAKVSEGKYHG